MILNKKNLSTTISFLVNKSPSTLDTVQSKGLGIFQSRCYLCNARACIPHLCTACLNDLRQTYWPACSTCSLALTETSKIEQHTQQCKRCIAKPSPVDLCITTTSYTFPADELVSQLKFSSKIFLASTLAHEIAEARLRLKAPLPKAICYIPSSKESFTSRCFNQAELIARDCAIRLKLPLLTNLLARAKETQQQSQLSKNARANNIKGAFKVLAEPSVTHVAVIDDVITTGATINEAARALKHSGIAQVEAWAFARTPEFKD